MEVYYFKYLLVFLSFRKGLGNAELYENTSDIFAHQVTQTQANTQYGAYIFFGGGIIIGFDYEFLMMLFLVTI